MKCEENNLRFFLGTNTPQGFVSRFEQLADAESGWREYVIKGGPGSGKSTMMKKIAGALRDKSPKLEIIHCSSDVDSIDAVIAPELKISVADGTPPHAIEPKFPGAVESIVDVTACWDSDKLYACREEIIRISTACSRCHEHCCRFLSAAGSLAGDTYRIALDCVNTAKLFGYISRLSEKEFKPLKKPSAREQVRFLSAVTNKGIVKFTDTAKAICERVYLVNDEYGAISRLLLTGVRAKAHAAGYDVICCYCPLAPFDKLEQLFVPELGLGFMTSNRFHDFTMEIEPYRIVNCQRFTDNDKLRASKKRMTFNRKAQQQMVAQAHSLLGEAKVLHDELETYYTSAMDFAKLDALTDELIAKIQAHIS